MRRPCRSPGRAFLAATLPRAGRSKRTLVSFEKMDVEIGSEVDVSAPVFRERSRHFFPFERKHQAGSFNHSCAPRVREEENRRLAGREILFSRRPTAKDSLKGSTGPSWVGRPDSRKLEVPGVTSDCRDRRGRHDHRRARRARHAPHRRRDRHQNRDRRRCALPEDALR